MADLEKVWGNVFDKGSKKAQDKLRKIHANNPRFQTFLNNRGEQGGSPSAAAAKKVKVEPRKIIAIKPDSIRALNAARQQAYLAKGGRQPIGAMGSGGSNVMAGGGQSTVKDLKASIKAGFNPRVSLDPYESERAKKTGPRSLKMKNEEVQVDEAMSPEAAKKKRIFDLKLKMIKKVANYKSRTKSSKVDEPHSSLNPASDMKLNPRAPSGGGKNYYKEETQIDEVTGYEGVKDRKDIIKRAAAMNRMGKDVFLARVKARAAEIKKEKASKELAKEEVQIDEVSKKEAEAALGGPVKDKPKGPAGKLPLGYRMARSAARRAMKGAVSAVHKSMEKTMQKEEVEQVVEQQDDTMQKKEMAQTQLHFIGYASKEILEFIDMGGEIEEWYQNKLSKVQSEVESLHSYIEGEKRRTGMVKEEEQIDEKAPPGAKFERMVKHIKKGYAKGGLTPKEKSIAYATAWKAYGKKNEEVEQIDEQSPAEIKAKYYHDQFDKVKPVKAYDKEGKLVGRYRSMDHAKQMKPGHTYKVEEGVVTEAEGKVAVTPKEKSLAAHHGDPKRITYGDVIKARLKSVAAKKMGK